MHRRLGALEVRTARGRGHRIPHLRRRFRRGGGRGGGARGRRRHLCRALQPRLLAAGLSRVARVPGRRTLPLQAGDEGRERVRDGLGRDPPGTQPHRGEARARRPRRRGGEDDRHPRPGGRRHPSRGELPQGGRRDRRRIRGRLRHHRAALLPEARRPGRGPRPHRGQEPPQRLRQPVGADPQGPRLRLLPRGLREEPDRGEPPEAHRLLPRLRRGGRGGPRRRGDRARPRQGRGVPGAEPGQRVPADEPAGHDLPRRVRARLVAGPRRSEALDRGPQPRRDPRLLHDGGAHGVRSHGAHEARRGRAGNPRRLDGEGRPPAGQSVGRAQVEGPSDRGDRSIHARGGVDAAPRGSGRHAGRRSEASRAPSTWEAPPSRTTSASSSRSGRHPRPAGDCLSGERSTGERRAATGRRSGG